MGILLPEILLQRLNVPYTRAYLHEYMERLPLNDSLWAINKTLEHYNIDSFPIKVDDKTKINFCVCPFIAQHSGDFVVVSTVSENTITFENTKGRYTHPLNEFVTLWSGITLLCQSNNDSGEPNYVEHHKSQTLKKISDYITIIASIALIVSLLVLIPSHSYISLLELVLSAIGLILSVLLLKKYLRIPSSAAEKLCNIISQGKCDESIGQHLAKPHLLEKSDLSELGLSFFGINTLALLLFHDNILPAICLSLILILPLSFWSIGWQLMHKSWCPLCLMVMITVWVQGIIMLLNNNIIFGNTSILQFVSIICCYWLTLQLVLYSVKYYQKQNLQKSAISTLQRFKYDKKTWEAILNSSKQNLPIDESSASSLLFGDCNTQKPLITIVGNPFCAPCAKMHHRVQPLIEAGFPIQYIYTYFKPDLAPVNKQIVATYIREGRTQTWEKLTLWYDGDKSRHPFNPDNAQSIESKLESEVLRELHKQNKWIENSGIKATPTVLINGIPLPSNFVVEDLLYLY